jgi:hypothetical protein
VFQGASPHFFPLHYFVGLPGPGLVPGRGGESLSRIPAGLDELAEEPLDVLDRVFDEGVGAHPDKLSAVVLGDREGRMERADLGRHFGRVELDDLCLRAGVRRELQALGADLNLHGLGSRRLRRLRRRNRAAEQKDNGQQQRRPEGARFHVHIPSLPGRDLPPGPLGINLYRVVKLVDADHPLEIPCRISGRRFIIGTLNEDVLNFIGRDAGPRDLDIVKIRIGEELEAAIGIRLEWIAFFGDPIFVRPDSGKRRSPGQIDRNSRQDRLAGIAQNHVEIRRLHDTLLLGHLEMDHAAPPGVLRLGDLDLVEPVRSDEIGNVHSLLPSEDQPGEKTSFEEYLRRLIREEVKEILGEKNS